MDATTIYTAILTLIGAFLGTWLYQFLRAIYLHKADTDGDDTPQSAPSDNESDDNNDDKKGDNNNNNNDVEDEKWKGLSRVELFKKCLQELGCKVERDNTEEHCYYVKYQGETFTFHIYDDNVFIHIYDPFWYEVSTNDIDSFSVVRSAINEVNTNGRGTILYTIDKEHEKIYLHTRSTVIFADFIPNPDMYLAGLLNDMLRMQRTFYVEIAKRKQ